MIGQEITRHGGCLETLAPPELFHPAGQEDRLFHIVGDEEDRLALFGVLLPEVD